MKKIFILLLFGGGLLVMLGLTSVDPGERHAGRGERYVGPGMGAMRSAFQDFYRSTTELTRALNRIGDHNPESVLRARSALIECRLHYKRIEYFLEYFFRSSAVIYNHPAKYEVEEPYAEFEEPRGLQVIEALLFEKKVFVVKDKLLQQATAVNESARDLGALLYDFEMDDAQLLESLRIELIRVMTLDISGYDAPRLKSGIAEAYEALCSMQSALQPYMTARRSDSVGFYLNEALDRLRGNRDFDRFDRMGFLTEAALPLQHCLGKLIDELGLEIHTVPALNYAAGNLFAPDAFDQRAFPAAEMGGIGWGAGDSLAKLGRRLFFEKALSGNYSRSCATCHQPGLYFTDGVAKSIAYDNISTVKRNAPSLLYAGLQYYQFWDGRAKDLEEQVIDVLTNPSEMHNDTATVGKRMKPLSCSTVAMALAAYIRTLSPMNSAFDRYMAGDKQAMTAGQVRGFNLFMGKAQCGTCHFAPLFNGLTPPLYATTEFEVLGVPVTDDLVCPRGDSDSGRYAIFPIPYYRQAFKTPTVRNSAVTAPYMHNGSFHTLKKVIEFYNKGGGKGLGLVTPEQTLAPEPLGLSAKEIREVGEFLRVLTDRKDRFAPVFLSSFGSKLSHMKNWFRPAALAVLTTVAFSAKAQQYVFDKKIAIPGDAGYDYMAIDSVNHHLFVSHGTAFNVVDLTTEQPIAVIDGLKGVHGIAFANVVNKGFISDGRGKAVVVVDLTTFEKVKTIDLPAEDEDGIIYDPYSQRVFCFCGDSKAVCVIDVHTLALVKQIDLGGGPEFAVSDGKGLVYNNIEDQSSLKVIDVKTLEVKATYPLAPCGGPTGIAYDPGHQRLFTGCRANKGLSVVDAVVYDAADRLIFASNGDATTTIIRQEGADQYSVIQTLVTQTRAKTMAMDMKTKKIYLSAPQFEPGTRKIVPGTFAVYVYRPS